MKVIDSFLVKKKVEQKFPILTYTFSFHSHFNQKHIFYFILHNKTEKQC